MNPFNPFLSGESPESNDRLVRLGYGFTSPLWFPFLAVAGAGVAFWTVSKMMRGEYASLLPNVAPPRGDAVPTASDLTAIGAIDGPLKPEGKPDLTLAVDNTPAAEPDLAPRKIERVENVMAHNPPPVEAGASAPEDEAPPPPVPAEHVMDHTPPETVEAPANPEVERRIEQAHASGDPDFLGQEPGGRAALMAETSAAVLGGAANFGGDMRAEETAEASVSTADEDAMDTLADAAYAENFGPVPTVPGSGGRSRKGRVRPGTAPGA